MPKFRHHIFVCTNVRPSSSPRGCCADRGAPAVRARMKEEIRKRNLRGIVRANAAGCLDQCECGVTVVIYPEGIWYGGVTEEDVPEIFDALESGGVVERLRIPDHDETAEHNEA
ncbi:MAG: (2Fe-2S) ferredoxin domain-containing protein [Deltaproteobacteria bacterium]|nr:MAG: (2Fe-2S) ferredoxin domain-containing protein [Deltaproteobacteria bacterium]